MTGTFKTDGSTIFDFSYPDGTQMHFDLPAPPEGKWVVGRGPATITDPDNNQTTANYNVPNGSEEYDQVVTPDQSTWRYHHASGDTKITKIEQATSGASTVEIGYDQGKPSHVWVKDASTNVVSQTDYAYENGKIKTVTKGSRKVEYTFAENNQVITVRDLDQGQTAMTETVYDYREPTTDPDNDSTTLTTTVTRKHLSGPGSDEVTYFCFYKDPDNEKTFLRRLIGPDGKVTTYDANTSTGRVNWVQDPTGLRTTYAYNSKGAVTTVTYSQTGMTTYHEENVYYDSGGDTVWLKTHETVHPADDSTRGNFTKYYRTSGTLWRVDEVRVDQVGGRVPNTGNWNGTDPSRVYTYYNSGDPDGLPGQLKTEATPNIEGSTGYVVTYKYTEAGGKRRESPVQTIYKYWNNSAYVDKISSATYDDTGNVKTSTDANNRTVTYEYDALGRATKTIYATGVESENHYTCCTMDWSKDEDGRTTYYAYDDMNRVKKAWTEIAGQGESTPLAEYSYDALGNTTSVATRSNATTSRTTSYTYDSNNRVTRVDYPSPLGHEEFGYDDAGSLWWKKDGNGAVTVYRYDDLHRLTNVYYNYAGALPPTSYPSPDVSYSYYGATGLVETMTESTGNTSSYIYNGRNQLTTYTPPQPASRTITYTYNNLGQKLSVTDGSFVTNYSYFANGWLKNVKKGTQTIATYTYDPVGLRTQVDFGNSTWQTFHYEDVDPRYRLDNIHYGYRCSPGGSVTDNGGLEITRDKAGNPLHWGDTANLYNKVYSYDKNNRLDSANYPGVGLVDFTYDWVGNRINPGAMQFNAADQLTAWPGQHTYEYYGDGSLHYQKNPGGGVEKTHSYSSAGLLSSVVHAGAGTSAMTWDAATNRIGFTSSTGGNYTFVHDVTAGVPAVIEEVTPGGSVFYLRDSDGALVARVSGTDTKYYHFDDLGSTLLLTDADGTVSNKYTYDAWGNVTSHTGSTSQPYQYVGQLGYYTHCQDVNMAGLLQLGVRLYDAAIGRFTQHGSPYTHAKNNPTSVGHLITKVPQFKNRNPDEIDANISAVGYAATKCALDAQLKAQRLVESKYPSKLVWGDTIENAVMHCTLTCTIASECGRNVGVTVTNNHEKYNWNSKSGPMDLANNAEGLKCFDWAPPKCKGSRRDSAKACFDCCMKRRKSGNLHLLPAVPVPKYPGGN